MNLNEILEKLPEDNATANIYIEKLKRKAEKGLLEGITLDDINTALQEGKLALIDSVPQPIDFEYEDLIKESQDAVNYYYKYISNISEAIQNIDNIENSSFLNESSEQNFDKDSLDQVKDILENLNIEEIDELLEYYSYINNDKKSLIESCIENEVINFLDEAQINPDSDIDELLQEGAFVDAVKNSWETTKSVGKNLISNFKDPKAAISGMSAGISNAVGNIGTAAVAFPLGALVLGGIYGVSRLGRKLISKAIAKRKAKKQEKEQMYESFVDLNEKKTIEDFLA